MNWNQVANVLLTLILIGFLVYGIHVYKLIKSDALQCANNPFTYSAEYTKKQTGADLMCSCFISDSRYAPFSYDINGTRALLINPDIRDDKWEEVATLNISFD